MRQWINVFVVLFVVALVAAFVLSSIMTVISASVALQQSIDAFDDLTFAERMDDCDPFAAAPCF